MPAYQNKINLAKGYCHCLLNSQAVDQYQSAITRLLEQQQVETLQRLLVNAQNTDVTFASVLIAAKEVLNGRADAADRFWLLLRNATVHNATSILPDHLLRRSYGDKIADIPDQPFLLDKENLQDLIGAVEWSARGGQERTAMVDALRQLLDPLFRLEYAFNALQQAAKGNPAVMRTLLFEHILDQPATKPDPSGPFSDIWKDRVDANNNGLSPLTNPFATEWMDIWGCMGRGRKAMSMYDRFAAPYHIDFISNPGACGGKEILITGTNFGPMGRVYFPVPEPDDPMFQEYSTDSQFDGVQPIQWDDSAVTVRVPIWAVSGMIRLYAFHRVSDPCWVKDIFRPGNEFEFSGGLGKVYQVTINGLTEGTGINGEWVIPPNRDFVLGYRATNRSDVNVSVEVLDEDGNSLLLKENLAGGIQKIKLRLSVDPGKPVKGKMIISASSNCGSAKPLSMAVIISVAPILTLGYVEITQGVQESEQAVNAGNFVPLAAGRDTQVRVFLTCSRGGWFQDRLDHITGAVRISGPGGTFQWGPTNTRPVKPDKGQIEVVKQSKENDETTTLNFIIPAGWCTPGNHPLIITVRCADPTGLIHVTRTLNWTWFEKRAVPVRWLIINKVALDDNTMVPQMDQFLRDALMYFPTPAWDVGPAWQDNWQQPEDFTTAGGWYAIADDIKEFKNCTAWNDLWPWDDHCETTDDDAHWIAVLRPNVPVNNATPTGTTPSGSWISVIRMQTDTAAHELGHQMGLHHVNLAAAGSPIAGPFDNVGNGGYLSRFAFNMKTQQVILGTGRTDNMGNQNPLTPDLMSYLRPGFFSHIHWQMIFDQL